MSNLSLTAMARVPSTEPYGAPYDSDSDEEDDPKSLVDRLIERGTLMFMDGENSGLSSECDSDDDDDDDDYSDYDSDSDITDVSPIISASSSPLGLSPVLPRRRKVMSPLALYDNKELTESFRSKSFSFDDAYNVDKTTNNINHPEATKSTDMDLLLQAVLELENQNNSTGNNRRNKHNSSSNLKNNRAISTSAPIPTNSNISPHPVRDNPHHRHLRKLHSRRKNMSFSNEEVRKIDRENKILLKKLLSAHSRPQQSPSRVIHQKHSHSSTNRRREEDRIRRENMILLRKIQEAKASKEVSDPLYSTSTPPLHYTSTNNSSRNHSVRPVRSNSSGSCGASMLSLASAGLPHVPLPQPRKETAL